LESAGADEGNAIVLMPLLEWRIARAVRAQHILDSPAIAGRQNRSAQIAAAARTLALGTSIGENFSNFPQDSLRVET
jgi:hypothetical protein